MKILPLLIFVCLLSFPGRSQSINGRMVSKVDSILLTAFRDNFKKPVDTKDKVLLEQQSKFPFYCRPCLDYIQNTDSSAVTVKVTRKIFRGSVFKLFFDMPSKNNYNVRLWAKSIFINPGIDSPNPRYFFSYARIEPIKEREGSQGFIYLNRTAGKYLITGLDLIP